jgi:DNA-binding protein HU-beta
MRKGEIIDTISDVLEVPKAMVRDFFEVQAQLAYREAGEEGFTIPGIGKLFLKDRAARLGRNPATGQTINIPAKKVVKFRLLKICKESIIPVKKKFKKK